MTNPRRTNSAQRNKVRARVLAEEDTCAIPVNEGGCGGLPVDKSLTMAWGEHGPRCRGDGCPGCRPHPMRAEVDEVVPVSAGGSPYDRSNCRLAHRMCNRKRHDVISKPAPNPFPLSNVWGDLFAAAPTTPGGHPVPPGPATRRSQG